jgi:hypothetical protein
LAQTFVNTTWQPPSSGNPDWLNPALWSAGVVPEDTSTTKYIVTIPGGDGVNLKNDPPYTGTSSTVYDLDMGNGSTLNVSLPLTVEDAINGNGATINVIGTTLSLTAAPSALTNPANIYVQSGGNASLDYTSLTDSANSNTTLSSDGSGSVLDLHTVQNLYYGGNNGYVYSFNATNSGTIELSGVTSITDPSNDRNVNIDFNAATGGSIKLNSLQTISATTNSPYQPQVNFNYGTTPLSLPALTSAQGAGFNVVSGGSLNAPLLTNISGSFVTLAGGGTFVTGGLSQIDNAVLAVNTGATLAVTATSYTINDTFNLTDSADGSGSLLDLHTVQNLYYGGNNGYVYSFNATNNGTIDLSGATSITDPSNDRNVNLDFTASSGGSIKLNSLQTISATTNSPYQPQVNFNTGAGALSLPMLANAQATGFNMIAGGSVSVPQLSSLTSISVVNIPSGAAFNAPKLTNITGSFITLAGGGTLSTGGLSQIDNAVLAVNTGATLAVTATSYTINDTFNLTDSADGGGSLLDLHTVQNLYYGGNNGYTYNFTATNNATVDLSGVTSITDPTNDRNVNIDFNASTGGTIKLNSLQTISATTNSPYQPQVNFNTGAAALSLPVLANAQATGFNMIAGGSVSVPQLSSLTSISVVNIPSGAAFNAPKLTNITGSFITLAGGGTLSTGGLAQIDNAVLAVNTGATLAVTATSYTINDTFNLTDSADGSGSLLDLHSLQSLYYGGNNGYTYNFTATNNATIDLSGVKAITDPSNDRNVNLDFNASTGGTIKLNALQTISATTNSPYQPQVNFNFGTTPLSLPVLTNAQATGFNMIAGGSVSAPQLSSLTSISVVNIPSGAAFNAPKLTNITGSFITLAGGGTLSTGGLAQIDNASLAVNTGGTLAVSAASYAVSSTFNLTNSADGSGSLLDWHTVQNLYYGGNGGYTYSFSATNNGTIDLSGVASITDPSNDRNVNLNFNASSGGSIKLNSLQTIYTTTNSPYQPQVNFTAGSGGKITLGSVVATGWSQFNINDASSVISVLGNLNLGSSASLNMAAGSTLNVGGSLSYAITNPGQLATSTAILHMNGNGLQALEVGGKDAGAVNPGNNGNFGFGQLQVGSPTSPTEVDLVDNIDNGDRGGTGGASEALYLYGVGGQGGLVLNDGSVLLIGSLNAYTFQDGSWMDLQNLFTGGQNIVSYTANGSDGYVARNLTALQAVWQSTSSGAWNTGSNWNINQAPGVFNDVFITPVIGVTVTGPTSSTRIRSLTIDATPAGTLSVLNLSSAATVTVDDNINIGGQGQINEQAGTLTAQQMTVAGSFIQSKNTTLQISGGLTSSGSVTSAGQFSVGGVFVNNGTYIQTTVSPSIGSIAGIGSTNIGPNVTLNVGNFTQLGGLINSGTVNIDGSGTVKSITGGGAVSIAGGTIQIAVNAVGNNVSSLSIAPNAALDLTNNHLFINYGSGPDPIASIAALVKSGYDGGLWNGTGIFSSTAQANGGSYGIGFADSADPNNPAGLSSGTIEVAYTLLGDANLDGKVNGADFAILAANFNKAVSSWDQGDFNYDGKVNGADFAVLALNFNKGASQSDSVALNEFAAANGLMADVPEPTTAGAIAAVGLGLLSKRRVRRRRA